MDKIPETIFPLFYIVSHPRFGENPACRKGLYAQAVVPDKNIYRARPGEQQTEREERR